jgi:Ni,Fe-hydrogenase I large subunit
VRNIILGSEFVMSHITHFYHLAALDYVQGPPMSPWKPYFASAFYTTPFSNVPLQSGSIYAREIVNDYVIALHARRKVYQIGALMGGRTPHTMMFAAGGLPVSDRPTSTDVDTALGILYGSGNEPANSNAVSASLWAAVGATSADHNDSIVHFVFRHYVPMVEAVAYLYGGYGTASAASDTGSAYGNFNSFGVFPGSNDGNKKLQARGYIINSVGGLTTVYNHYAPPGKKINVYEFITHSWYNPTGSQYYNIHDGYTLPSAQAADWSGKYTFAKSPRIGHGTGASGTPTSSQLYPMEVGPLARMVVTSAFYAQYMGQAGTSAAVSAALFIPSTLDPTQASNWQNGSWSEFFAAYPGETKSTHIMCRGLAGITSALAAFWNTNKPATFTVGNGSFIDRHFARALEAGKVTIALGYWLLDLKNSYINSTAFDTSFDPTPSSGQGTGMNEAPRGTVSHYSTYSNGKISNYQIIAPTTWNIGPGRNNTPDTSGGIAEKAVQGVSITLTLSNDLNDNATVKVPVEAVRVLHSFDFCIACTVHLLEKEDREETFEKGGRER